MIDTTRDTKTHAKAGYAPRQLLAVKVDATPRPANVARTTRSLGGSTGQPTTAISAHARGRHAKSTTADTTALPFERELITLSAALAEYRGRLFVGGLNASPAPLDDDVERRSMTLFGMASGLAFGLECVAKFAEPGAFNRALEELPEDGLLPGTFRIRVTTWAVIARYIERALEHPDLPDAARISCNAMLHAVQAAGILALGMEVPVLALRLRTHRYCETVLDRYVSRKIRAGRADRLAHESAEMACRVGQATMVLSAGGAR